MTEQALAVRAVIYRDRDRWLAQCLEYDLCTSAGTREELMRKVASQLRLQITLDLARGKQPFQGLPRAPQRFWEMFSASEPGPEVQIRQSWLASLLLAWRGRSRVDAKFALAAA